MLVPVALGLLLLLLSCGARTKNTIIVHCAMATGDDLASLLDFKRQVTLDPGHVLRSWNSTTLLCDWAGVTCGRPESGGAAAIIALDLGGHGLRGQISPSLGNLTSLVALDLSSNAFSGEIPPLGRLRALRSLDLGDNTLHGAIPSTLTNCSGLSFIRLTYNYNLAGPVPRGLGNLTSLRHLGLGYNLLQGGIPEEIGRLHKLRVLVLGHNLLSGAVPVTLFNLSLLQRFSLVSNQLQGSLPFNLGDLLPDLQFLHMAGNRFEGSIPPSIGNASGLLQVDLASNGFTGTIPASFGRLQKLFWLGLVTNNLEAKDGASWQFLRAMCNCSLLQVLGLYGNQLQGVVPDYVGNLSSTVEQLSLGGSQNLSGIFPSSIGNLRNMNILVIRGTRVTGTIGEWIGRLENMQGLYLESNNFLGSLPSSIGNLSRLTNLNLDRNEFEGLIPSTLGNLSQLSTLDVSYNNLRGEISGEIFKMSTMFSCLLSHNHLQGHIPMITNLQQLAILDISSNKLTGEIPATLGTCQGLQTIQMGHNFLSGSIPKSLGNLSSLTTLNLSHNNLSGDIPAALCNIDVLTQLDLSYNHLKGEVPTNGVFQNVTAVSLDANFALCGGVPGLHMPACPAFSQETGASKKLIKIFIPVSVILALLILLIYLISYRKKRMGMVLSSVSSGKEKFPKVSYKDLAQATENFAESNLIGRGSYSSVYKGKLIRTNMTVAVKVFDMEMNGANRSYMAECEALRSIRHRNLVQILTTCSTVDNRGNDFKALVYLYMSNGNLETWLHQRGDTTVSSQLNLCQRINIIADIADALQYLHHDCLDPVIHCDLKPSNILLDDNMTAHLGDFGIARIYLESRLSSFRDLSSIGLKGTIGYVPPEYAGGGYLSTFGDVYSFGVVLLEILTGRRPTDPMFCNELTIINFVERNYPNEIIPILDAYIQEECQQHAPRNMEEESTAYNCLLSLTKVALSCTCQIPNDRMDMREAAARLRAIKISYMSSIGSYITDAVEISMQH
ncbi:unnamed protein product [Urochloa humidicola]